MRNTYINWGKTNINSHPVHIKTCDWQLKLAFPFLRCTKKGLVRAASLFFPKRSSAVAPWRTLVFFVCGDAGLIFTLEI